MRPVPFREVFHPSDFSEGDTAAFAHALGIALACKGELNLLHVNSPQDEVHWSDFPSVRRVLADWGLLPSAASHSAVERLGLEIKKIRRIAPDPATGILNYLHDHEPDLLVLSTHQRHGLSRIVHPSMAETLAERSRLLTLFVPRQCAGFISRETGKVNLRNILVPVDHSPSPRRALEAAYALAERLGAGEVSFSCLYAGAGADRPALDPPERAGWTFESDAWDGPVVERILEASEARNADLIVMATRGRHGLLDALRGSTTQRVLRESKCPVLAVPERQA